MAIVISDTLYSEENMLRIWNDYWSENNKKYIKKARRDRPTTSKTELGIKNPLYYLIFDEGVPIAYSGIENNGTFYASAGMFVTPEYHRQGLSEKLLDKKLQKSGSKPYITFVNNLSPQWMGFLNRKGLIKADIDNLPDGMPENIVQKEIDAHGEDNVLIYNNSEVVKSWQEILKKKKKKKKYKSPPGVYTQPKLRESIHATLLAENTHGTAAGQWSGRKSQELNRRYRKRGGGFVN